MKPLLNKVFDLLLFAWVAAVLAAALVLYFIPKFAEKFPWHT